MRRRIVNTMLIATSFALLTAACASGTLSPEQTEAVTTAAANTRSLQLTSDISTTQMLDGRSGEIVDLSQVVTGDRAVLLWYWAPT